MAELVSVARETGNEEAISIIEEADDPVLWAERHLRHPDTGEGNFRVKRQFYNLLRSSHKDRAVRVGRQSGKTVHMLVDILHTLIFSKNVVITVFVTSIPLMNRMITIMTNLIRGTDIEPLITKKQRKRSTGQKLEETYDHAVHVENGNKVYFFAMNKEPDKARGQYATHVYVDEADFMPQAAWPVITGILKRDSSIKLWASSTPSGISGSWFERFCKKCRLDSYTQGAEFHIPSTIDDEWELIEPRLRASIHDEVTWALEVLAEFVEPKGAVYKKETIDHAVERWDEITHGAYPDSVVETAEYRQAMKFLGIDWNTPQNGVRIIELATMWGALLLTRSITVAYEEYTQIAAVRKIVELMEANNYSLISVDEGYGATQIELLKVELSTRGYDVNRIINVVDSNRTEEIAVEYVSPYDHQTKRREYMRVKTKYRIVGLLAQYLETELALPPTEDREKGVINEIRNFRRKGKSGDGGFLYSENSHSLSALQIAIHGYDKFKREHEWAKDLEYSIGVATTMLDFKRSDEPHTIYRKELKRNSTLLHRTQGLGYGTRRTNLS